MKKSDLAPMMAKTYVAIRQHLEMSLELTCGLKAVIDVLEDRNPGFALAYTDKLQEIKEGELGKRMAADLAAIDQVIEAMRSGQLE
jgi:hypothetical protein